MKKLILIIAIAFSFSACKKGEDCLINGTWKVDKVEMQGKTYPQTSIPLSISIKNNVISVTYPNNETSVTQCTLTDNEIVLNFNLYRIKYKCFGNHLIIYDNVSNLNDGKGNPFNIISYLSK